MKATKIALLGAFLTLSTGLSGQDAIPSGTVLPVQLNSSFSLKTQPGRVISARVMQDVPLSNGTTIHEGANVVGHVITVNPADKSSSARISFKFDKVVFSKRAITINASLRAMASYVEVEEAQLPESGPDRGTPENAWTTDQVGGDIVYRGGGPVVEGSEVVGKPVSNGVLGQLRSNPVGGCGAAINGNDQPLALWVFSSDACGLYGLPGVAIAHAGRSSPVGEIVLTSKSNKLNIHGGNGMLLRVISDGGKTTE